MAVLPILAAGTIGGAPALAQAPLSISPQRGARPAPPPKPARQSQPARKPAHPKHVPAKPKPPNPPAKTATAVDEAYGAFQRGHFLSAFDSAMREVNATGDAEAMTLLGELYASGYGIPQDDNKAAEWYQRAVEKGNREAMFALAMFRLNGRAGPKDVDAAVNLLTHAAELGHVGAAYDLGLLYLEGKSVKPDPVLAFKNLKAAADVGSAEAQYVLAGLYRDGKGGIAPDRVECARLLGLAARAGIPDAQLEFAIALYNGDGVPKNEARAEGLLLKVARRGNPVAQNRLAHVLASGRGVPANPVEAAKWHIIARTHGEKDAALDSFLQKLPPEQRQAGEKSAEAWLKLAPPSRS